MIQATETKPAIRVKNLARELSGVQAVRDISFEACFGQVLGLLGPNGAGKTTTLRILAGLLAPSTGTVEICGKRYPEDLEAIKSDVGFLTGGMKLYDLLSPRESLRFFGGLRNLEGPRLTRRIDEIIAQLDMGQFCNKRFSALSSGEKQRTVIANAILHDPRVLILDEITASLDIISSAFILDFIKKEKDRGKCIVFSTHIMSEAEYLCDTIGLIHRGRLIDQGRADELIARHRSTNLTAAFLSAVQSSSHEQVA